VADGSQILLFAVLKSPEIRAFLFVFWALQTSFIVLFDIIFALYILVSIAMSISLSFNIKRKR